MNSQDNETPSTSRKLINSTVIQEINIDNVADFSNVCRICATVTEFIIPIFSGEGLQNNLSDKINKHLPIKVSEQDVLPCVVCFQCASTVLAWHELVKCCLQADSALRTRLPAPAVANQIPTSSNNTTSQNVEVKPQNKSTPILVFHNTVKHVLSDYLHTLNVDENNPDVEIVCQKCDEKPSLATINMLVEHLNIKHLSEVINQRDIENFIKENITFEEVLEFDESVQNSESETEENVYENKQNFFCPFCENVFTSSTRLIYHLNKHVEVSIDSGIVCCEQDFHNKKIFLEHLQRKHINKVIDENVCRSCGLVTGNPDELQTHILNSHSDETGKNKKQTVPSPKNQKYIPAVCPECNKTFSNKYNMFIHLKSHSRQEVIYKCGKCNKIYQSKGNLKNHLKIAHHGILNYLCTYCGEAFPSKATRDVHTRLHTGIKPYECEFCNKTYRAKNTLDRHLEIHYNIRKYECSICSKKFRKSTHLNYHINTHKK